MDQQLTQRELDIISVLWSKGPSTVAEVREALDDDLAHTTVLTMLRLMESKGHVSRAEEGRGHRYAAVLERDAVRRSVLGGVMERLFGGRAEEVLVGLVRAGADGDTLRRMREVLDARLAEMEDDR